MLNLPIKILEKQELTAATASVTFSSIDTLVAAWDAQVGVTSRHLVLIVNAASPDAVAKRAVEIQLNGDSAASYNHQWISGEDAVADADRQDAVNSLFELVGTDYPFAVPGTYYASAFGGGEILFPHAFGTVDHKVALGLGGAAEDYVSAVVGRWASIAAITSLVLSLDTGNFASGSIFLLGVVDERYLVEEIEDDAADFSPSFDDIPQMEGDLVVVGYARSDQAAVEDEVVHAVNDDSVAGNYPAQELTGRAGVIGAAQPNQECAMVSGDNATANAFGALVVSYSQYIKGNNPVFLSASGYHETGGPTGEARVMSGQRSNTEPINKLLIEPNAGTDFKAGSLFSLYLVPKRLIDRQELTVDTASITFSSIPDDFESLVLAAYTRTDKAAVFDVIDVTINSDAVAANYTYQRVYGAGGAAIAIRSAVGQQWGYVAAATETPNEYTGMQFLFPAYAKTDRHKHVLQLGGRQDSTCRLYSMRWKNTNAIISIVLTPNAGPNFLSGSVFELWGILPQGGLPASEGMKFG